MRQRKNFCDLERTKEILKWSRMRANKLSLFEARRRRGDHCSAIYDGQDGYVFTYNTHMLRMEGDDTVEEMKSNECVMYSYISMMDKMVENGVHSIV